VPEEERTLSMASIRYFRPTGEPDVDIEALIRSRRDA
jgi:hypothetical protein